MPSETARPQISPYRLPRRQPGATAAGALLTDSGAELLSDGNQSLLAS